MSLIEQTALSNTPESAYLQPATYFRVVLWRIPVTSIFFSYPRRLKELFADEPREELFEFASYANQAKCLAAGVE